MNSQSESSAHTSQAVYDALLDYARSPGKSNVALREPALLFASIRQVLQIAAGRDSGTSALTDEQEAELRRGACFFTHTALLFPGADHYTLMGVDRNFDEAELKDHYRLLMRLIHPDFAGSLPVDWPADAATRVNLAYEVLSSPVRRSEYERSVAPKKPTTPIVEQGRKPNVVRKARTSVPRSNLSRFVFIGGLAAVCAVLIGLLLGSPDPAPLVQRGRTNGAQVKPAAQRLASAAELPARPETTTQAENPASVVDQPAQPQAAPIAAVSALMNKVFSPASTGRPAATKAEPPDAQSPAMPVRTPPSAVSPERVASNVMAAAPSPVPLEPAAAQATAVVPVLASTAPHTTALTTVRAFAPEQPPALSTSAAVTPEAPPSKAVIVAAPISRQVPAVGITLGDVQPLLTQLLHQLESGFGERVIGLLERDARNKPEARALSRQYDELVAGVRPVRLSQIEFNAEPAEGRLLVSGRVYIHTGAQVGQSTGKKMVLRAEFASRDGTVVMTGLSSVAVN